MNGNTKGFSLIELMIGLTIFLVVMSGIFQVITLSSERSTGEQIRLDMVQQAREFMDQMSRDLRQAGYPNPRVVGGALLDQADPKEDADAAAGLVKVGSGDLWFEGDVDGAGTVSVIRYHYVSTGTNCPCLQRSQTDKVDGDLLEDQTENYLVELNGIRSSTIFRAYSDGALVTLPIDIYADPFEVASIDTIEAVLTLEGLGVDPRTGERPMTTLITTVKLNNCSQAEVGGILSCQ